MDGRNSLLDLDQDPRVIVGTRIFAAPRDLGDKTKITWRGEFPSAEARARVIKEYGADKGLIQTMARLADFVELQQPPIHPIGDPDTPVFSLNRTFDAPRELVWKAWTDAKYLSNWWGPKGSTIRVVRLDVKPSGIFHYAFSYQPGAPELWGRFIYREVVPPEKLVYVSSFSNDMAEAIRAPFKEDFPLEILNTLILSEAGGRTTLQLSATPINASSEQCAVFAGWFDSMRQGFGGTLDQLERYLPKVTA